jgi:predicted transcriptional regulator
MTVREVAEQLGCNPETVKGHIRELFPGLMQNGKMTLLDEKRVAIILEKMKQPVSSGTAANLQSQIAGTETALTPALKLEMLYRQIDEIKTAEIARLKQDREALQIRLSEAEQWYSVKRVLIETGREYPWKPLKEYSVRNGYAVEKTFDKNYGEVNAYHRDVWNAVYGVEL